MVNCVTQTAILLKTGELEKKNQKGSAQGLKMFRGSEESTG